MSEVFSNSYCGRLLVLCLCGDVVHLYLAMPLTAALSQAGTAASFFKAALDLGAAGVAILFLM